MPYCNYWQNGLILNIVHTRKLHGQSQILLVEALVVELILASLPSIDASSFLLPDPDISLIVLLSARHIQQQRVVKSPV